MVFEKHRLRDMRANGQLLPVIDGVLYFAILPERPPPTLFVVSEAAREEETERIHRATYTRPLRPHHPPPLSTSSALSPSLPPPPREERGDATTVQRHPSHSLSPFSSTAPSKVKEDTSSSLSFSHPLFTSVLMRHVYAGLASLLLHPDDPEETKRVGVEAAKSERSGAPLRSSAAAAATTTTAVDPDIPIPSPVSMSSSSPPLTALREERGGGSSGGGRPRSLSPSAFLSSSSSPLSGDPNGGDCALTEEAFFFSIASDPAFAYPTTAEDFGPLDVACVVRFIRRLSRLLHYTNGWEWGCRTKASIASGRPPPPSFSSSSPPPCDAQTSERGEAWAAFPPSCPTRPSASHGGDPPPPERAEAARDAGDFAPFQWWNERHLEWPRRSSPFSHPAEENENENEKNASQQRSPSFSSASAGLPLPQLQPSPLQQEVGYLFRQLHAAFAPDEPNDGGLLKGKSEGRRKAAGWREGEAEKEKEKKYFFSGEAEEKRPLTGGESHAWAEESHHHHHHPHHPTTKDDHHAAATSPRHGTAEEGRPLPFRASASSSPSCFSSPSSLPFHMPVVFTCGMALKECTNAVCLLGCFCVAALHWTPSRFLRLLFPSPVTSLSTHPDGSLFFSHAGMPHPVLHSKITKEEKDEKDHPTDDDDYPLSPSIALGSPEERGEGFDRSSPFPPPSSSSSPLLQFYTPLLPFRDASPQGGSVFPLSLLDVLHAVRRAVRLRWLSILSFSLSDYRDGKGSRFPFTWIIPHRVVVVASPEDVLSSPISLSASHREVQQSSVSIVKDQPTALKKKGDGDLAVKEEAVVEGCAKLLQYLEVSLLLRLPPARYSTAPLLKRGIQVQSIDFPEGSLPIDHLLLTFFRALSTHFGETSSSSSSWDFPHSVIPSPPRAARASSAFASFYLLRAEMRHHAKQKSNHTPPKPPQKKHVEDPRSVTPPGRETRVGERPTPPHPFASTNHRQQRQTNKSEGEGIREEEDEAEEAEENRHRPSYSAVAVHGSTHLGAAATLLGAYLMQVYRFTAREAIGWIRLCCPGSVMGEQQLYLDHVERRIASSSLAKRPTQDHPSDSESEEDTHEEEEKDDESSREVDGGHSLRDVWHNDPRASSSSSSVSRWKRAEGEDVSTSREREVAWRTTSRTDPAPPSPPPSVRLPPPQPKRTPFTHGIQEIRAPPEMVKSANRHLHGAGGTDGGRAARSLWMVGGGRLTFRLPIDAAVRRRTLLQRHAKEEREDTTPDSGVVPPQERKKKLSSVAISLSRHSSSSSSSVVERGRRPSTAVPLHHSTECRPPPPLAEMVPEDQEDNVVVVEEDGELGAQQEHTKVHFSSSCSSSSSEEEEEDHKWGGGSPPLHGGTSPSPSSSSSFPAGAVSACGAPPFAFAHRHPHSRGGGHRPSLWVSHAQGKPNVHEGNGSSPPLLPQRNTTRPHTAPIPIRGGGGEVHECMATRIEGSTPTPALASRWRRAAHDTEEGRRRRPLASSSASLSVSPSVFHRPFQSAVRPPRTAGAHRKEMGWRGKRENEGKWEASSVGQVPLAYTSSECVPRGGEMPHPTSVAAVSTLPHAYHGASSSSSTTIKTTTSGLRLPLGRGSANATGKEKHSLFGCPPPRPLTADVFALSSSAGPSFSFADGVAEWRAHPGWGNAPSLLKLRQL